MNAFVGFVVDPSFTRNSLILIGATFRTFSEVVSDCFAPFDVHCALATRSPLNAAGPDVIVKVAFTLAPAATGPGNVSTVLATEDNLADSWPAGKSWRLQTGGFGPCGKERASI